MIASRCSRCTPAGSINARWSWIALLLVTVSAGWAQQVPGNLSQRNLDDSALGLGATATATGVELFANTGTVRYVCDSVFLEYEVCPVSSAFGSGQCRFQQHGLGSAGYEWTSTIPLGVNSYKWRVREVYVNRDLPCGWCSCEYRWTAYSAYAEMNSGALAFVIPDLIPPRIYRARVLPSAMDVINNGGASGAVAALEVYFNESMDDSLAGAGANDVSNAANWRVVSGAGDGVQTTSCDGGVSASDAAVFIDAVTYNSGTHSATLSINGGAPLLEGEDYRLLACAASALRDSAGNPLDGDWNGVGGDDYLLSFRIDSLAPSDPAVLDSTSHSPGSWSASSTVAMQWSGAADNVGGAGLAGYSVQFDTLPSTLPDAVVDVAQSSDPHLRSQSLSNGDQWYFHLRTCDKALNCTSTLHVGPFWIDLTPPSAPGAVSSASHGDGLPHADSTIDLSWGAATDALSGLGDYLYAFDNTPAGPCTGGGSTAGTSAASASLADGIWYAHVCSTDLAGNSSVVHGGPYRIGADLSYASTLVSHQADATATTGNGASSGRYLSADGRYVAFSSLASDLVVGGSDSNGVQDAFLWDRVTNLVTLISHLPGLPGTAASGEATATGISSDGAFVAFHSTAADMIAGGSDSNGAMDGFLWERATGIVTLISHAAGLPTTAGDEISYTANGAISADGQRVAIYSNATNLVAGATDVSATTDALMWDRATDLLTYVSHLPGSPTSAAASYSVPSFMSADGEFVAFYSQATNLMSGGSDANGNYDVFLWERATGDVALASHVAGSPGVAGSGLSSPRAISSDGEILVYLSYSTDLVPGFSNNNGTFVDTFAYVRSSGESELLSRTTAGPAAGGNSASYGDAVSADGRYVLLTSASTDLAPGVTDPNGTGFDLFLRDRVAGTTRLLTPAAGSPSVTSNNESVGAGLSSDGRFAFYKSLSTDLIAGMTAANSAGEWDVYLVDTALGDTDLLSHSASSDTTTANAECLPAGLASGGAVALMECAATDLATGVSDPNGAATDLYVAAGSAPDSTPPTDPTISSTSPSAGTWSNDNTVQISWSGAADEVEGSGLAGYSIAWDHAPLSTPDPIVDVAHGSDPHSTTSPPLADAGDWYFHLRTCDNAGNCTATVHAGPFWIDTTAPPAPAGLASSTHTVGVPSQADVIAVLWSEPVDNGSGLDGYSWAFDANPSWTCETTKEAEEGTTAAASAGLPPGAWYFHLCGRDSAGNWSPVATAGPYLVTDTVLPATCALPFETKWGSFGSGPGQFQRTFGVAAAATGEVVVADYQNNRLQVFDRNGVFVRQWATAGGPISVAVDLHGHVVVSNLGAQNVQMFNLDGTFVRQWATGHPYGLTVDASGATYAVNDQANVVTKYDHDGNFVLQFGSSGSGPGQFLRAWGATMAPGGDVLVTDVNGHRVERFTSSGVFVSQWGSVGSGAGQLSSPTGIAVSSDGIVYVSETGNQRIQAFTLEGFPLCSWGSFGSGNGQFYDPLNLAAIGGHLYVADQLNNRIQKFGADGIAPTDPTIGSTSPAASTWSNDNTVEVGLVGRSG